MKNDPFASQREAQRRAEQMRQGMQQQQQMVHRQMQQQQQQLQQLTNRNRQGKKKGDGGIEAEQARLAAARRAWIESEEGRAATQAEGRAATEAEARAATQEHVPSRYLDDADADDLRSLVAPSSRSAPPPAYRTAPQPDTRTVPQPGTRGVPPPDDRSIPPSGTRSNAFGGQTWGGEEVDRPRASGPITSTARPTATRSAGPKPRWRRSVLGQAREVAVLQGNTGPFVAFRLERYDDQSVRQRPVAARLEGQKALGFISEGDWVEVEGTSKHGNLHGRKAYNHSTESDFKHSHLPRIAIVVAIVFFLAWFAFVGFTVFNGINHVGGIDFGQLGQQIGQQFGIGQKSPYDFCLETNTPSFCAFLKK